MENKIKIGLFGIGLDTYWSQFEGLLDKLESYQGIIKDHLTRLNAEVTDAGMVDNPFKAIAAAELFNRNGVDLIILNISTYALCFREHLYLFLY
jgi:L-arabinose isomerase